MTESIDEVEELMDCDGPLYDLGWDGISAVSQEVRPPSKQGMAAGECLVCVQMG